MPSLSQIKDYSFVLFVGIWYSCHEGQFQVKVALKKKMINSDSSDNDSQIALTRAL